MSNTQTFLRKASDQAIDLVIDKNINISWYSNLADSSYQELQNLTNILKKRYFKDIKFPGKAKEIHKIDKKNDVIDISNFVYENKEKRFNQCIKECKKNMLIYY